MECLAGNDGGNLGPNPIVIKSSCTIRQRPRYWRQTGADCLVPWCNRSEVNQFNGIADWCQRLVAAVNERAPRDDGKRGALRGNVCLAELQQEIVAGVVPAPLRGIEQRAVFKENRGIVPAQGGAQ